MIELLYKLPPESQARRWFESVRWPKGPVCPHCGAGKNRITKTQTREVSKSPARPGLYRCRDCDQQFTVTVGTIFEGSHIPLRKWMVAIHIVCESQIPTLRLYQIIGLSYKSTWHMVEKIRSAFTQTIESDYEI